MEDPKIEKGIPIPPSRPRQSHVLALMDIGDSVLMTMSTARIHQVMKDHSRDGRKFISRKDGGGRRVWRVS